MKSIFYLFLFVALNANSQYQIHVLKLKANDIIYSDSTKKIYASLTSSNGSNGNSIGIIDPQTVKLDTSVFIGSEPSVLAISRNSKYIYAGFKGASIIRRFNVFDKTSELQFSLGIDNSFGAMYAEDIEVIPGTDTSIAVSRKSFGFSPSHVGVAIYDNNIRRLVTTQSHTGSNKIEFNELFSDIGSSDMIGFCNESTEFGLRNLSIDKSGITEKKVYRNIIGGFGIDFILVNNICYSTNGSIVDYNSTPFVIGTFTNANGPIAFDNESNLVCFLNSSSGVYRLDRYNASNYILKDSYPIKKAHGKLTSLIKCGKDCYAFNTLDTQIIILKKSDIADTVGHFADSLVNANKPSVINTIETVKSKLSFENEEISFVQIFDYAGSKLCEYKNDFSNIESELLEFKYYFVKVHFKDNTFEVYKYIKPFN